MQFFWSQLAAQLLAPITWIVFLFGAIVGSFLNVCIFRIPAGTFWGQARSVCPACQAKIPFDLNIPVLSYVLLRGRARCCGARLSPQYPLVELLTAVLFAVLYWQYPFFSAHPDFAWVSWDYANLLRFVHASLFVALLIVCAVIDLRLMIIPDVISIPMILLTPVVVYFQPGSSAARSAWGWVMSSCWPASAAGLAIKQ